MTHEVVIVEQHKELAGGIPDLKKIDPSQHNAISEAESIHLGSKFAVTLHSHSKNIVDIDSDHKMKAHAVRQGCLVYNEWRVLSVPGAQQQGSDNIMLCLHVL